MSHFHAVVWLDHREARIFYFNKDDVEKSVVHPDKPDRHLHSHVGSPGDGKLAENQAFYDDAATALSEAGEILVLGPGTAKLHFLKRVHARHAALEAKIVGIETVDHPSDKQVVAYARHYFAAADRMLPQR